MPFRWPGHKAFAVRSAELTWIPALAVDCFSGLVIPVTSKLVT